jgi:hypothetical protein
VAGFSESADLIKWLPCNIFSWHAWIMHRRSFLASSVIGGLGLKASLETCQSAQANEIKPQPTLPIGPPLTVKKPAKKLRARRKSKPKKGITD